MGEGVLIQQPLDTVFHEWRQWITHDLTKLAATQINSHSSLIYLATLSASLWQPSLSTQNQINQQNVINTQLANIATQQQHQFQQEDQDAKQVASTRNVQVWLGDQPRDKFLSYSHAKSKAGLAPIWSQ